MITNVIKGIVFSIYDEKIGPTALSCVPTGLDPDLVALISTKTLSVVSGEENNIPSSLELLSFPSKECKGLVKYDQFADSKRRGGLVNVTLTAIFEDKHDNIFYKYKKILEDPFEVSLEKIRSLMILNRPSYRLKEPMIGLKGNLELIVQELHSSEFGVGKNPPFLSLKGSSPPPKKRYRFKVITCGDPEVGKTSLILKYTDDAFRHVYLMTMGVNVSSKTVRKDNTSVDLAIWDIAGHAKWLTMRHHYYDGAHGIILACDSTRKETFMSLEGWRQDLVDVVGEEVPIILALNKLDVAPSNDFNLEGVDRFAEKYGIPVIKTSALDGTNVDPLFEKLVGLMIKTR